MLSTIRILVVGDDADTARETRRLLEHAGYVTSGAVTGAEAMRSVRADHPQLVLLDCHLPDMDGHKVCRLIKADPSLARIFVVIASAAGTLPGALEAGLEPCADGYLVRPMTNQEFRTHMQAFVRTLRLTESLFEKVDQLQAANALLTDARLAALNLMDDTLEATEKQAAANRELREEVARRERGEHVIQDQLAELQRWNQATLGRESRVLELKRDINRLLREAGKPPRFAGAEVDDGDEVPHG